MVSALILTLLVAGILIREAHIPPSDRNDARRLPATNQEPDANVDKDGQGNGEGNDPTARPRVVIARDLADGRPVHDLRIRVARTTIPGGASPAVVVSDESGRAELAAHPTDTILLADGTWLLPHHTTQEILSSGELWVYRMMSVVGDVQPDVEGRGFDPSAVVLTAVTVGLEGYGALGNESPEPWCPTWMRQHGLEEHTNLGSPAVDRSFSVSIPCIQGIVVRAAAPGWRNALAVVPTNASPGPTYITLRLQSGFMIGGTVCSESGAPISGARVDVYVSKRTDFAGLNREKLKAEAHEGYSASWDVHKNLARVTYLSCADTDDAGAFSAEVKSDGDILIVVHARGYAPVRSGLGYVGESRESEAIVARSAGAGGSLILSYGGKPLARHMVMVADLSVGELQPAVEVDTDDTGALPTEWLEVGRQYYVLVTGPMVPAKEVVAGTLTWSGQKQIDMRELAEQFRGEK